MAHDGNARPAGVVRDERHGCWVVSSRTLVEECFAMDGDALSSNFAALYRQMLPREMHRSMAAVLALFDNVLTVQDDPYHAHVRGVTVAAFNRALKGSMPAISDCIECRVRELGQRFDLVADLADPVAKDAISLVIDIPPEQRERLIAASTDLLECMEFGGKRRAVVYPDGVAAERALGVLQDFFEQQIARFESTRTRGFMGQMLRDGPGTRKGALSETEYVYQSITMLMAGFVTMTSLLARSVALLAIDGEDVKAVAAESTRLRRTVETLIRRAGPTAYVMRHAVRPISLGGAEIGKGDLLQLRLVDANHDAAASSAAKEDSKHLAFGSGIHACPGAPMAKLLLTRVLESLARQDVCVRAAPDDAPELSDPSRAIIQYTRWPAINASAQL